MFIAKLFAFGLAVYIVLCLVCGLLYVAWCQYQRARRWWIGRRADRCRLVRV